MRRIVLLVSALAAAPAFAQYSNYGYENQQYYQPQAYTQQGYQAPQQQQYYQQPQQTYQVPPEQYQQAQYQQPVYQQPIAQAQINPAAGLVNTDYLSFGLGLTQVVDTDQNVLVNAEYRYKDIYYGLRPILGFQIDNESAMYGYAGFNWDLYLTDQWILTPSLAAGLYSQGDGHDLGHAIEFRSSIELAYEFESKSRLGLSFYHLSNAGIGNSNPGTEILQLNYAHPLGWLE